MPRKVLRSSAPLPAASAWDDPASGALTPVSVPEAAGVFGLEVTVTRAAGVSGGGAVSLLVETSEDSGATWSRLAATNTGGAVIAGGTARVPVVELVYDLPAPAGDAAVRTLLPFDPGPGARVRVRLQERDAPASAGTAAVALVWRAAR